MVVGVTFWQDVKIFVNFGYRICRKSFENIDISSPIMDFRGAQFIHTHLFFNEKKNMIRFPQGREYIIFNRTYQHIDNVELDKKLLIDFLGSWII